MDDFAGLKLTSTQQVKVDEIHGQIKTRIHTVIKSNLNSDQKSAMVQGLERMERNQVFAILDPEQRQVVAKRVLARRQAARLEQEKAKQTQSQ
jgi:hypothetical protein